ncbi:MAG: choice-of-anchor X domain-containing protein [Vicinamibacteria bacterium]
MKTSCWWNVTACLLAAGAARAAEPAAPAPAVSLQAVAVDGGRLPAGEAETKRTVVVDRATALRLVLAAGDKADFTVELPDGTKVTPDALPYGVTWTRFDGADGGALPLPGLGARTSALVGIEKPLPGTYAVRIRRAGGEGDLPFVVTSLSDSDVRLGLWVQSPYVIAGQPLVLAAVLADRDAPVRDADVTLRLARADAAGVPTVVGEAELRDDGRDADAREGDGVYSAIVPAPAEGATWANVRARGRSANGDDYERTGAVVLQASKAALALEPRGAPVWRKHGELVDALVLELWAEGEAGEYDAVAIVRAPNGRSVTGGATFRVAADGTKVRVEVPSALVKALGVDGPYAIEAYEAYGREGERTLRARRPLDLRTPPIALDRLE